MAAATLVKASTSTPGKTLEATVGAGLEGRWRTVSAEALGEWCGMHATSDYRPLPGGFGWLEEANTRETRAWTMTAPRRKAGQHGVTPQTHSPATPL